jgi:hypothetical protein
VRSNGGPGQRPGWPVATRRSGHIASGITLRFAKHEPTPQQALRACCPSLGTSCVIATNAGPFLVGAVPRVRSSGFDERALLAKDADTIRCWRSRALLGMAGRHKAIRTHCLRHNASLREACAYAATSPTGVLSLSRNMFTLSILGPFFFGQVRRVRALQIRPQHTKLNAPADHQSGSGHGSSDAAYAASATKSSTESFATAACIKGDQRPFRTPVCRSYSWRTR